MKFKTWNNNDALIHSNRKHRRNPLINVIHLEIAVAKCLERFPREMVTNSCLSHAEDVNLTSNCSYGRHFEVRVVGLSDEILNVMAGLT